MIIALQGIDGHVKHIKDVEAFYAAAFCNGVVVRTKDGAETYYSNCKFIGRVI